MAYEANYQTITTPQGLKHVYTLSESPYSIYLSTPIKYFFDDSNSISFRDNIPLKTPKHVTNQELIAGIANIDNVYQHPINFRDKFIFASIYPPIPHREFYESIRKFGWTVSEPYPPYEEEVYPAVWVNDLLYRLTSTYDIHTTWGTAKNPENYQPDFSRSFSKLPLSYLRAYSNKELDNYSVLLSSAWMLTPTLYELFVGSTHSANTCGSLSTPLCLDYIITSQEYSRLLLNYHFSGLEVPDYFLKHDRQLTGMLEDIATALG